MGFRFYKSVSVGKAMRVREPLANCCVAIQSSARLTELRGEGGGMGATHLLVDQHSVAVGQGGRDYPDVRYHPAIRRRLASAERRLMGERGPDERRDPEFRDAVEGA